MGDVMTPRTEVVAVSADAPLPEVIHLLAQTGFSRVPVIEGRSTASSASSTPRTSSLEELVAGGLRTLMRKAAFVPESKKVSELLKEFRRGRPHLRVVVDEHGGTAGLVTVADVVEEILGHIRDEDEVVEGPRIQPLARRSLRGRGRRADRRAGPGVRDQDPRRSRLRDRRRLRPRAARTDSREG